MSNRVDEIAAAVADGDAVDWESAEAASRPEERKILQALRTLAQRTSNRLHHGGSLLRRRLPLLAELVKWLSWFRVLIGAAGTIVAIRQLDIPRLPFVLAVVLAFAVAAFILDLAGRDPRPRVLGLCYWTIAAAFAASGVTYLALRVPMTAWLMPFERLHPEVFLGSAMWLFARAFPRLSVRSRLDVFCAWAARVCAWLGALLFVLIAAGLISIALVNLVSLAMAVPAVFAVMIRAKSAEGGEAARVRLFLLAILAAVGPVAVTALAESLIPAAAAFTRSPQGLPVGRWLVYTPLLALPFFTGYAVAATNVLPVRVALHAGLRYVLAKQLLQWLGAATVGLFIARLYQYRDLRLGDLLDRPDVRPILWVGAVVAVLFMFRRVLMRTIDRWAGQSEHPRQAILTRMTARLREARTLLEVADVLAQGLEQALHAPVERFLIRMGRLVPVGSGVTLPLNSLLPVILAGGEACVVGEGLSRTFFHLLNVEDQEWVTRSHVAAVIPLMAKGADDALGMVAVTERRNALTFSAADLEFLNAATASAILACDALRPSRGATTTSDPVLADVGVQCVRCGLVEAWESAEGRCACGGAREPAALPREFDGWLRIEQRLGTGGMGVVYRGSDLRQRREVAVKTLTWLSPEAAARSIEEARTMSGLAHGHLAALYETASWQGTPVLVMEYLAGGTLAAKLKSGPLPANIAVAIVLELSSALEYLHGMGVYHGDIKPSNIGLTVDGVAKFLDFGLTRTEHASRLDAAFDAGDDDAAAGPITGGTPAYLSPEVWKGAPAGTALDLWAMAVVLCEALAGRHPYGAARDARAIADRVRPVICGLRPGTCPALCDFLEEMLCGDRNGRASSASEFRDRLAATTG